MKRSIRRAAILAGIVLFLGGAPRAQQLAQRPQAPPRGLAGNAAREIVLEGQVLRYTASATTPPLGAHVVLQTAGGAVDVPLGAASYLQANHFSLASGDVVRIAGVQSSTRQGSVFLARVIQKGGQALVLRTAQGAPLGLAGARASGAPKTQPQAGAR
ncbi:MAG: hypothetical protein LAN84_04015 [Acidobacteriia bacterium]|nr:hypothetical protein [Terriglobia bacterium]